MQVKSYRDLLVWQKAMDMTSLAYQVSASFPADERFGLTSQARRAAVSVPANIAEGHQRATTKDYLRFVSIALGSLAELQTLVELATRVHSISSNNTQELGRQVDEVGKMLRSLQLSLQAKLPSP